MADNFDKLLFSIGSQADGKVPYADALENIKVKAEFKRAKLLKRNRYIKMLSIAASLIVVFGVGTILLTNGFFASSSAEPEAASTDTTAAYMQDESSAPAPAALYGQPAEPTNTYTPESSEAPLLGFAPAEYDNGSNDLTAGGTEPDEGLRASNAPEESIFTIGLPKTLPSPTDVTPQTTDADEKRYTLELIALDDAPCEIGEAAIYQVDDITVNALWRIAETDYISISAVNMSVNELLALMNDMIG